MFIQSEYLFCGRYMFELFKSLVSILLELSHHLLFTLLLESFLNIRFGFVPTRHVHPTERGLNYIRH